MDERGPVLTCGHCKTCVDGCPQCDGPLLAVPCDDAAIDAAVEWATHAGVKPMREFVEGIIAALAGAPLGCPCVGTPDQDDCPHG